MKILFVAFILLVSCQANAPEYEYKWTMHIIEKGHTLWAIASAVNSQNTKTVLNMIMQKNDVNPNRLLPGTRIWVPCTPEYHKAYSTFGIPGAVDVLPR